MCIKMNIYNQIMHKHTEKTDCPARSGFGSERIGTAWKRKRIWLILCGFYETELGKTPGLIEMHEKQRKANGVLTNMHSGRIISA